MATLVEKTGVRELDALLWGYKWDTNNLSVRFPVDAFEYNAYFNNGGGFTGFQPFSAEQAEQIYLVVNNLSAFVNLNFTLEGNYGFGNLRFGQVDAVRYYAGDPQGLHQPGGRGSAEAAVPDPTFMPDYAQGDTWYTNGAYTTPQLGNFQRAAGLMHEVGHALGLKHGHHEQETGGFNRPTLPTDKDGQEFSIMTYRTYIGHDPDTFPSGDLEYPWTFMQLDIQALQYLYGPNFNANAGDTTYKFSPTTGEFFISEGDVEDIGFGPSYNASVLLTIWDGDGNDTYDFANHSGNQIINLEPGAFSTFSQSQLAHLGDGNFARGNVANALLYKDDTRSLIENAKTGAGNDIISGNSVANRLEGGDGDDVLIGKAGADVLIGGSGNDTLDGGSNPEGSTGQGDILLGGTGNDLYLIDSGLDLVDEGAYFPSAPGGGTDTIISGTDFYWDIASVGEVIRVAETATDIGNDGVTLVGGIFDNRMEGNSKDNIVFGRGGSDTYQLGDGVDWISLSPLGLTDANAYAGVDGVNTVIVEQRSTGVFSYDIIFEFEAGKDKVNVADYASVNELTSGADVLARAVNDGVGNSYIALGDGYDYLYMVGLEKADLAAGDFLVA